MSFFSKEQLTFFKNAKGGIFAVKRRSNDIQEQFWQTSRKFLKLKSFQNLMKSECFFEKKKKKKHFLVFESFFCLQKWDDRNHFGGSWQSCFTSSQH